MKPSPLPDRDLCHQRLSLIFPPTAFDSKINGPLAGAAVAVMIYVNAIAPDGGSESADATWVRPSTIVWMSDAAFENQSEEDRLTWLRAALIGKKKLAQLVSSWGSSFDPWYADNTREGVRDDAFRKWLTHGAVVEKQGFATTASSARWALTASFAGLFDPSLTDDALMSTIERWRATHLDPGALVRIQVQQQRQKQTHQIAVELPSGATRWLAPGDASIILKAVVEDWAPARLADPIVITISEPGDKVYTADARMLANLGLVIDQGTLLPDAVIVDIGSDKPEPEFWIIEAVASDGPIDEDRKRQLLAWAVEQRIPAEACRFLTAFVSRGHKAAKKLLKDLASGTYAFFADEPTSELAWYHIDDGGNSSD